MGFEVLVIGGGDDFRFDRALKIGDFLGALIDQQDHDGNFRVIGGDGVGNLFENGGLARARRGDNESARAFADGGDQVDDPGFQEVGRCLKVDLGDGINSGQVLEADGFGVSFERLVIDFIDRPELRAVAAVRRLGLAGDQAAFPEEIALDGVRRDKDVAGLWVIVVLSGAQKAKSLFGDFKKARTVIGGRGAGSRELIRFLCKLCEGHA